MSWGWWGSKKRTTAEAIAGMVDLNSTAVVHFPSMTLVNTSLPGVPMFYDLRREEGPRWYSTPQRSPQPESPKWEQLDEANAATIETAYQRFLRVEGTFGYQTKDWFRNLVARYEDTSGGTAIAARILGGHDL